MEGSVQVRFGVRTLRVPPWFDGFLSGEMDTLLRGSQDGGSELLHLLFQGGFCCWEKGARQDVLKPFPVSFLDDQLSSSSIFL